MGENQWNKMEKISSSGSQIQPKTREIRIEESLS